MILFPAIDIYEGRAVRLLRGEYDRLTVYGEDPSAIALDFRACGAEAVHIVDLEGARSGDTPNFEAVCRVKERSGLFCEIGGGIRSMEVLERYFDAGLDRVVLGTAAVRDRAFLADALRRYGGRIAVGVDIRDGFVAVQGWTENSGLEAFAFCRELRDMGVRTLICTDISRDGAMQGTNHALYRRLRSELELDITASGGVSSMEDIQALAAAGLYGAIVGKAYYTGAIDLREAVSFCRGEVGA
ncbi:MAG: 1-(5-phosphoribosyl)-5-[Oscillospiraceae bacterium]|nr:1-(5-phosphoribosyl)-5-[(5-phosphoribosylamino)methylideneamino]imidazole-4-carboxamide isomerase [Oscillospiraceae bacterium]